MHNLWKPGRAIIVVISNEVPGTVWPAIKIYTVIITYILEPTIKINVQIAGQIATAMPHAIFIAGQIARAIEIAPAIMREIMAKITLPRFCNN